AIAATGPGSTSLAIGAFVVKPLLWPVRFRNHPAVFILQSEGNPLRMLRDQIGVTVGPLDERNAVAENVIVESQPEKGFAVFDPVKIEMVNGQAAIGVFVHEHERGTGYFGSASHPGDEAFDELRFARAEIARQREHISPSRRLPAGP